MNCRLVVVSCPRRKPIQEIWKACQLANWPDCPYPIDIMNPDPDVGWNANLLKHLRTVSEEFILLMLDDNFINPAPAGQYTQNIADVLVLMEAMPNIGLIKLQAGGAHAPEIPFPQWNRLREYDRVHHPFKRTNLVPSIYRRTWLQRFSTAVLEAAPNTNDKGRLGALEFESTGTLLTADEIKWPEKMLGIHRPLPDGGGGDSLLDCIANDAVLEGKMRPIEPLMTLCKGVEGIEAFL